VDDRNRTFGDECVDCSLRRRCRGIFGQYLKHRGAEELHPVSRPSPNSFNFAPDGEPESLEVDSCPILAGQKPPPDPVRGIALADEPGRIRRLHAASRDFSDETIRHVVRDLGQVYLDRASDLQLTDFSSELGKLVLSATCRACPKRVLCGGVWKERPGSSFEKAQNIVSGLLAGLEGSVLEVGCGREPDTSAYQPALREGRLRYLGIDPRASGDDPGILKTTLEDFEWTGPLFDCVVALRSLNHLVSAREGLSKMTALMAAGGRLILAEDVVFSTVRSEERIREIQARDDLPFEHRSNFFPAEVASMITDYGLKIVGEHSPEDTGSTLWILVCQKERGRL
jgi:hypothetical protein